MSCIHIKFLLLYLSIFTSCLSSGSTTPTTAAGLCRAEQTRWKKTLNNKENCFSSRVQAYTHTHTHTLYIVQAHGCVSHACIHKKAVWCMHFAWWGKQLF